MWQSNPIDQFLTGVEGIRPAFRVRADSNPVSDGRAVSKPVADFTGDSHRAATAYLQREEVAVVVVRPDRQILCLNGSAKNLLRRSRCLRMQFNRLALSNPRRDQDLGVFLGARPNQPAGCTLSLRLTSNAVDASPLFLRASWHALDGPDEQFAACLTFHQPHVVPHLRADVLVALYGLTRTEARLVTSLFHHPVVERAADRCSISINTAKSHLKRIFIKCGVGSKAELLRLLALGPH